VKRLALYFNAPYEIAVREEAMPSPAAGQVLVQALVSAISAGTELLIYRGHPPADICMGETIPSLAGNSSFPLKFGYATVGRVTEVGGDVDRQWQGKTVFAFQPHESHFLSTPAELMPVPSGLSHEEASLLPNMETSVNFIMDGQPLIGEQVAVFGQGVVGLLTTALLARLPLSSLVTLDRYPLRRRKSLALGAQASLDPEASDAAAHLASLMQKDTPCTGADLTYELSGSPAALEKAIEITGFNGRVVIGSLYGHKQAGLNLGSHFHRSRIRLISSQVSTISPEWTGRWTKHRRLQIAWQMLQQLRPAHLITHRFPLAQASRAYQMLDQHPEEAIQVVLTHEG
jgi:2-desacetyl-2-hydroxyethyl bacteriochlorophyllide A dehydrogenase